MPYGEPRVGYVMKVFPRRSETFIVTELLAQERAGLEVEVFSLRPSGDQHAHAALDRLQAPVTYIGDGEPTLGDVLLALMPELGTAERAADVDRMLRMAGTEKPRDVMQALEVARHVRERGITHLHAHFANVAASVARMAAALAGITYSVTAHAKDIFHEEVDPAKLAAIVEDASSVISVSDFNVAHLRHEVSAAAARVHRVYNGIELEHFPFSVPDDRPPRILAVGRLVEKKGFDDLIDACAAMAMAQDCGAFECRIVGEGVQGDALRRQVAALGLEQYVTFTGAASQEQVRKEMASAAVLAVPCVVGADGNRDGLPTVLLEAMALGTPCVATPVTGIPEVLIDGRTGLEVPQRSPLALAAALTLLLEAGELRVALARRARRLIEERFDVDRNVADWRRVVLEEVPDADRLRLL